MIYILYWPTIPCRKPNLNTTIIHIVSVTNLVISHENDVLYLGSISMEKKIRELSNNMSNNMDNIQGTIILRRNPPLHKLLPRNIYIYTTDIQAIS